MKQYKQEAVLFGAYIGLSGASRDRLPMDPKGAKRVPQEVPRGPGGLHSLPENCLPFLKPLLKKLPTDRPASEDFTENFIENWPPTGESAFSKMFASNQSVSDFVSQVVEVIVEGGENPARFDARDLEKHIDALTMGAVKAPVWQ